MSNIFIEFCSKVSCAVMSLNKKVRNLLEAIQPQNLKYKNATTFKIIQVPANVTGYCKSSAISEINHWMNGDISHQTGFGGKATSKLLFSYQIIVGGT